VYSLTVMWISYARPCFCSLIRCQRRILFSVMSVCEWVCASQKPREQHSSKTDEEHFAQFWLQMYLGS